jgi:hypothetical protein
LDAFAVWYNMIEHSPSNQVILVNNYLFSQKNIDPLHLYDPHFLYCLES